MTINVTLAPLVTDCRVTPDREQSIRRRVAGALMLRWPGSMPGDPAAFRLATGPGPLHIRLTRVGPRALSPTSMGLALHPVAQELRAWLGGVPERLAWTTVQERGEPAVRVEIEQVKPS